MKYLDLAQIFSAHEANHPRYHLDGLITFSDFGPFENPSYTQLDRTYAVSSNNKAFLPNRLGFSIFGTCLNGKDPHVRLEHYMRQPNGWVPCECCLIFYQLQCVSDREFLQSSLYPTQRQAIESMLQDLCTHGRLEYDDVPAAFDNGNGQISSNEFEASRSSAWLNAGSAGNWDWVIQPIYLYDTKKLAVGVPFPTPDIRIEAPIPGKAAVGIEVPNKENHAVMLREILQSQEFQSAKSRLSFAVGKDIAGKPVVTDIAKMPHLLIAGATGSGKSVCINTLIVSILYKASPEDVKLIMIDPKVVELSVYNGIPHLFIPVVTDPKKAAGALNWAVTEMMNRYNTFAEYSVRNLQEYNRKVEGMRIPEGEERPEKMPQIVIIVDELADLMMVAPGEVEDAIVRLSQLARAAGIHLVIATQRPSVNVITGLIKANVPSRIAFSVSSGVDSRTIIDMNGAEKLLGKGDMLFYPSGYQKPIRVQGAFVSDEEVSKVVEFLKEENNAEDSYGADIQEKIQTAAVKAATSQERDEYFEKAAEFIIDKDKASIASLQRVFKIGFNRAARLMDQLCEAGIVGEEEGTKPRKVLMSEEQFEQYKEDYL